MKTKQKASEILRRTISALVLAPIAMLVVYLGGIYFQACIIFICVLMSLEWTKIVQSGTDLPKLDRILWNIFGFIYVVTPCICLLYLRELPNGLEVVLWLLFCVWATDIGAYFIGTALKGPKIAPQISPKKTWSGLVGGTLCAATVGYLFYLENIYYTIDFFRMSIAVALISQIGDFLESAIKRYFSLKDSGSMIPGHGGILDRVDGLVTSSVFVAILEITASR